jgi:hypothetical protein
MKTFEKLTESDKAFDKLYLFNLLNKTNFATYYEAKNSTYFRTVEIIEKLNPRELHYLTEKIENLL